MGKFSKGRYSLMLAKMGAGHVTGMDFGEDGIREAKKTAREMNLEQITRWVEDNNINPEPVSGKQEYLENIFIQNAITK